MRRMHMRRTRQGLMAAAVVAVLLGFALTACAGGMFASGTWRYRMTVTIATPEGDKTGTAVRAVSVQRGWSPLPEMQPDVNLKGEAVVVDLGQRGVLFALLTGNTLGADYGSDIPAYIFMPEGGWLSAAGIEKMSHLAPSASVVLPPKYYPMFVTFKDVKDPKTVEALSTTATQDQPYGHTDGVVKTFEETFGAGVRLKSVTIQMTKDPVTWGIDKWLPWLPDYYSKMLDGQRYNSLGAKYPVANSLASGAFKVGDTK